MTNHCGCCHGEHASLVVFPASNPKEVALCEDCRGDVVWYLVATSTPVEIGVLFARVRDWRAAQEAGENVFIPAEDAPLARSMEAGQPLLPFDAP